MNPKEIEDQIKGLLGLRLGASPVDSNSCDHHVHPGPIGPVGSKPLDPIGPPSRGSRPSFNPEGLQQYPLGFQPSDQFGPPGLLGPIVGPIGPSNGPLGPPGYVGPLHLNNLGSNEVLGLPRLGGPPLVFPGGNPIIGQIGHLPGPELIIGQHNQPNDQQRNIVNVEDDIEEETESAPELLSQKSESVDIQNEEDDFVEDDMLFMQEMEQEQSGDNSEDLKPSQFVKDYLSGKYLYPLAHKSNKFPRARWFCRLCEYHCDNLAKCKEHYSDTRHTRLTRTREIETTLYHLPRPTKHHIECLNSLLVQVEREQGIGPEEVQQRKGIALAVHNLLQHHIPGCTVRLYGSSLSGFGLKTSNVNLDLQITSDQKPHLALLKALEVLHESPDFLEIVDEFTAKIPIIRFTTVDCGLECELSLNNHNAYQTSSLLSDYWSLDPRIRTVGVVFRYWAHLTRLARQAEGTLPSHTFAILLVYYAMQQTKPLLPCIHDWLDDRNDDTYVRDAEKLAGWRTQNKMSPAELWIELFSFLAVGFNSSENVVSLRKSGVTTNEEKQWKTKKLAVEDPFSPKRNLCRSIQAVSIYDYISDCLKTGYLYFGTIQTSLGPIISRIVVNDGDEDETDEANLSDWNLESWLAKKGTVLTEKEAITASNLVPRNMLNFQFDCELLTNGTVPVVQCLVCGQEGHLPSQCPEEQLPPLESLPQLSHQHVRMVDNLCESVARDWEPQELELRDRDYIMSDLNRYIKKFWPKAELTLFGSSSNGFAFRHSDLDISLTFKGVETSEGLDCIKIIEELAEKVKRMVGMRNVVAITSAKVPIVKLFHQQCQVDADLSLYNVLARENTRLLSLYSDLDPRVRILGYMVKLYAKVCEIGDASRGSLSSYAYILMMIFYLQKCNPPVVPVLQELYPNENEKPKNMVDGWNAWFFSDRRRVVNEWPGYGRNRLSVGELWLGFLNFYAGQWDDKRLVVSIRQSRNLTKFEKMWNSPCIAIEDPFELAHNLGAGISRKMNLYIKKAFINGRKLYGTPLIREPPGYRTVQDYFFDPDLLTDGAPPNDRGCRACGKIGHLVADCPRKKAADAKKKQQRQERQRSNSESTKQHGGEQQQAAKHKDGGRNRTKSEIPKSTAGVKQQDMPGEKLQKLREVRKQQVKNADRQSKLEEKVHSEPLPVPSLPQDSGFDLGAFAAGLASGQDPLPAGPEGHLLPGAFTLEELEASFHTTEKKKNPSEERAVTSGPPPGFGGPPLLQDILGQLSARPSPPQPPISSIPEHIVHQQMLQRQLAQLEHQGQIEQQMRMAAAFSSPDQVARDPLGLQSLAGQVGGVLPPGPMMMPMLPFALPPHMLPFGPGPRPPPPNPMGLMFGQSPPIGHQPISSPAPGTLTDSPATGSPQPPPEVSPTHPLLGSGGGWPLSNLMFGPLTGNGPSIPPIVGRDTGFPSSVLFPGDFQHPLSTNPLPIPDPVQNTGLATADQLADGSPMTPPNLNLESFNFED